MSQIKECFVSRFGDDGVIMEADFSQLEVIGLAFLSQDKQLMDDIRSGIDMHCMNVSFFTGEPYEAIKYAVDLGDKEMTAKRKKVKSFSFLIQYGGGAAAMAAQSGMAKAACQVFIDNFYTRYPEVKQWQEDVAEEVRASRKPSAKRTKGGMPAGMGQYTSITGRRYVFTEYDAPEWMSRKGVSTSFSPTQMKNYPVQGFATGDIVPLVIGEVYDVLKNDINLRDDALLINTIHDSVLLDVHKRVQEEAAQTIKEVMERAPEFIEQTFGFKFDLPLKVEVEAGSSWATKVKIA